MWANTAVISSTTVYKLMLIIIFSRIKRWLSINTALRLQQDASMA